MSRNWSLSLGRAQVLLLIVSVAVLLVPVSVSFSASSGSPAAAHTVASQAAPAAGAPTVASDKSYYAQLSADLLKAGDGSQIAALGELPLSVVQNFVSVNLDPSSSQAQVFAADSAAYASTSHPACFIVCLPNFNWGGFLHALFAVGAGCATGALVGAIVGFAAAGIGALPGAGVGCVAGAAAGAIGYIIGASSSHASGDTLEIAQELDAAVHNNLVLINNQAIAIGALLPATSYFWYRLADVAAQGQIGNSTWNAEQDLNQSTIVNQLATATGALTAEANDALLIWQQALAANGIAVQVNGVDFPGNVPLISMSVANEAVFGTVYNFTNSNFAIPNADHVVDGAMGLPATFLGSTNITKGSNSLNISYFSPIGPGPFHVDVAAASQESGNFVDNAGEIIQWNIIAPESVPYCPQGSCSYAFSLKDVTSGFIPTDQETGGPLYPPTDYLANFSQVWNSIAGIEANAVVSGQTYWSYLRSIGYTNPEGIPAKFTIIPPAEVMPPELCIDNNPIYNDSKTLNGTDIQTCDNLNFTELNSLYMAWLASLARFFNSTNYQNGPSPCSSGGCVDWGNLNDYNVGSVYIPGKPPGNHTFTTEQFGNVATWNVTRTQLIFFPQLLPVTIPTDKVWEVPSNAPMQVYAPALGELFSLTGNGTQVKNPGGSPSVRELTTTAGDAVYLTSCQLDGISTSNCTQGVYNVNITVQSLTCSANSSQCPTPPPPSGGLIFSLGGLACSLLSAFGLPCTGVFAAAAAALVLIVVIAIVAIALYVVYRLATYRRGGGGTLYVTGGGGR